MSHTCSLAISSNKRRFDATRRQYLGLSFADNDRFSNWKFLFCKNETVWQRSVIVCMKENGEISKFLIKAPLSFSLLLGLVVIYWQTCSCASLIRESHLISFRTTTISLSAHTHSLSYRSNHHKVSLEKMVRSQKSYYIV